MKDVDVTRLGPERRQPSWRWLAWTAALGLAATLLLVNLGDRWLWDDEAQTALLARQVLLTGVPAFDLDGNVPTDRTDRADFNDQGVFTWNTWLPYYLTAAGFAVFGESEWSARLPFALAGLAAIALFLRLCQQVFGRRLGTTCIAAAMLVLSVPFLLHARQCRYYPLVVLATLVMVLGYLAILRGRRLAWITLALGALVCFHSFFAVAVFNCAGILLHAALTQRRRDVLRQLILAASVFLAFAAPFIWYMELWDRPSQLALTPSRFFNYAWTYLLWINGYMLPFAVPALLVLVKRPRGWPWALGAYLAFLLGAASSSEPLAAALLLVLASCGVAFWRLATSGGDRLEARCIPADDGESQLRPLLQLTVTLCVLYVIGMALRSPFPLYRYLLPLLPLLLIAGAEMVRQLFARHRLLGAGVLLLLIGTTTLSSVPLGLAAWVVPNTFPEQRYTIIPREIWRWTPMRSDLANFLRELQGGVVDAEEGVARFLRDEGKPGDIVKASYGDLSLMYYVPDMKVISRWDGGGGVPDFVIVRDPFPLVEDTSFRRALLGVRHEAATIDAPNVAWANNPDPLFHRFVYEDESPRIVIYRRLHRNVEGRSNDAGSPGP